MKEDMNANINSYLTFKLGKESFAANVGKVLEILEVPNITRVPKSPEYMTGVINLRGNVLPVIDTRIKFGLPKIECNVNTCIIVINVEMDTDNIIVGALVDSVQEVLEIQQAQIQPSPSLGSKYKAEFLEGMTKFNEEFIMLLNIDKVFSSDELIMVKDSLIS